MFLLHCDTTSEPPSILKNDPAITAISVSPSSIQFSPVTDGYKDTTITFAITSTLENSDPTFQPIFLVSDLSTNQPIQSGTMNFGDEGYLGIFTIETSTTSFTNLLIEVYAVDETTRGNSAQAHIEIAGFSNNPPQIIEINSPTEVQRPDDGSIPATFTAKVTDQDGQQTIDRVLIRVIDIIQGESANSPFQMFDDGNTFNDAVASDSVYTIQFPVDAIAERPTQNFRIEYFAIDQGGLISDTVRTTFRISNN